MGSAPVRHEHSLEGPVALEDLVVEPVVGAAVGAVDTVVRAHDGPRMALLHGRAERGEVDLAQGPLADVLVDGAALGLLVVRRKMLHRRDDALALDARRDLAGEHAREERVLRQVLEVAPVLGHPVDVHRGPEHDVDASRPGVASNRGAVLPCQVPVPRGRQADGRRVGRRRPVVAHAERTVGHLDLRDAQTRDAPIRKEGCRPAVSKIHASIEVVVVLPCVPATTSTSLPSRNSSCRICGSEQKGIRWSRRYSNSTLPRESALPTNTRSGCGCRFASTKGCATGIPSDSRKVDMGGYDAASEPVTRNPRSCSMPAREAMAVPQMPMRCMCFALVIGSWSWPIPVFSK